MSLQKHHEGFSPSSRVVEVESPLWGLVASTRKKTKSSQLHSSPVAQGTRADIPQVTIQEQSSNAFEQEETLIVDLSSPLANNEPDFSKVSLLHKRIYKRIQDGAFSKRGKPDGKGYEEAVRSFEDIVDFGLHARTKIKANIHLEHAQIAS